MRSTPFPSAVTAALLALCACAAPSRPRAVAPPTPAQSEMFARVRALEGTWEMLDEQGQRQVAAVFQVSSNGSVVRELMFPGSEHEMTNVYHMDGPSLVMTHYCAGGNQPRMRARALAGDRLAFAFDSVTNLTAADESYMGELTLVFVDADHLQQEWRSFRAGVHLSDHSPVFELERQR